jgi:multiple sugar transport system substrate-binding protein
VLAELSALSTTDTERAEDPSNTETDPLDLTPDVSAGDGDRRVPPVQFATVEPLGPGWAGQVLLARAAAYARHRSQYSTLFDYTTMRPLIDGPPFVRALEELVAAAEHGPPEPWTITPEVSRHRFWNSEAAMALSWPTRNDGGPQTPDTLNPAGGDPTSGTADSTRARSIGPNVKVAALPGSVEVYQFLNERWEQRSNHETQRVPLLAIAGRTGSVARQTPRPRKAFAVLAWLSGGEWSRLISPASSATTLFRTSHVPASRAWLPANMNEATSREYAEQVETTQSSPTWLITLRLPGRAEYMAALDDAVHQALRNEATPEQALKQAAAVWNEITDRSGRQRQRDAYQRSIGVGP